MADKTMQAVADAVSGQSASVKGKSERVRRALAAMDARQGNGSAKKGANVTVSLAFYEGGQTWLAVMGAFGPGMTFRPLGEPENVTGWTEAEMREFAFGTQSK